MSDMLDEQLADLDRQLGIEPATEKGETAAPEEGTTAEPEDAGQPEGAQQEEQEQEEPGEELIGGKFKTQEALVEAYQRLEQELGSRNKDWQELNQLRDQLGDFQQQTQQQFQTQQVAATAPLLVQQLVDNGDYQQAADVAAQMPDQGLTYNRVMAAWADLNYGGDPSGARMYQIAAQQQALLAQQQQQMYQLAQTQAQTQAQQAMTQAFTDFSRDKPDLQAVAPEMLKVAEASPKVLALLQDNDPQVRVDVLDYLYTKARGRVSTELGDATQAAAEQQKQETNAAKKKARVGSASQTVPTNEPTEADQWAEDIGLDDALARYYG